MTALDIILSALLVILAVYLIYRLFNPREESSANREPLSGVSSGTIRCPTCGAQATVKGDRWECGWCWDFGSLKQTD